MIRVKTERKDNKNFVVSWTAIPKNKCPEVSEAPDVFYLADSSVPAEFHTRFYNYYVEEGVLMKSYVAEQNNR